MATVGDDFDPYAARLEKLGLSQQHIRHVPDTFTWQAFITTDLDDNQITAFHPGAMNFSEHNHVGNAENINLGIVLPDGREGMLQHAREFHEAGIPWVFDPGQGVPMFSGEELLHFVEQAGYLAVSDYEAQLLQDKTWSKIEELAKLTRTFIVTLGAQGSIIYADSNEIAFTRAKSAALLRPYTGGHGDVYRAGLLHGI